VTRLGPKIVAGPIKAFHAPPTALLLLRPIAVCTLPAYACMQPAPVLIPLTRQLGVLLLISLPVACISWTVTHEEVFREPREFCKDKSKNCRPLYLRKLFYLFTCEYCFSHYVSALFPVLTRFQMLYAGWRGYLISEFALVWVANLYMSVFNRLRLDIKSENLTIEEQARSVSGPGPVKLVK
jgi:hypothetical protein